MNTGAKIVIGLGILIIIVGIIMKIIYYLGKDASIFESLESLSKIKKNFVIKRIDLTKQREFLVPYQSNKCFYWQHARRLQ